MSMPVNNNNGFATGTYQYENNTNNVNGGYINNEKQNGFATVGDPESRDLSDQDDGEKTHLHRGLKSRQVAMIAIGGAIGTGLIIGTGGALVRAGPGNVLIAYAFVGIIAFLVMAALGEMAAWLPVSSGFTGYAHRFVDPALGFALGWNYWFKYIIVTPNNLTAFAAAVQFWVPRTRINPGVWITIALVAIVLINYFGVKFFGEFEFWLSSIKVIVILALIILCIIIAAGGVDGDPKGFRYWHNPGAFKTYLVLTNIPVGKFLAFWSTLTTAVFAYLGIELVGVTVGECANPRRVIPRAINLTFYRILVFYVLLVFLLGMILAYNDPLLITASSKGVSAAASPFVVAIQAASIPVLPGIFNACVMIFVFSAANSDLYIASRTLYGLAIEGNAPSLFKRTDRRGVPIYALGGSSLFLLLAYLNVSTGSGTVFTYFVALVTVFGLLTWISILICHIFFVRARKAQGVPNSAMPYVAPLGAFGSYFSLVFCILILIFRGFPVFFPNRKTYGSFDWKTFLTTYLGIPLFIILFFGYKIVKKSKLIKPEHADIYSGKALIDAQEQAYLEEERLKHDGKVETKMGKVYRHTIGALF